MGLSCRILLLDEDDRLYRLSISTFDRMLRDPDGHALPRFAGTRVRMSEVMVELEGGRATRVVRISHSVLTFDARGCIDTQAYKRHHRARAELAMDNVFVQLPSAGAVVDAATQFAAQGGRWMPSPVLAHRIEQVAIGRVKCPRL